MIYFIINKLLFLLFWISVQTAKDADQALTILQGSKGLFDIIISEFNLIGMNGFDFLKLIQNEFHIPVISKYHSYKFNQPYNFFK